MKRFDLLKTPLTGTNLIEASAGTGKTYTITGVFLRLILEKQLPVENILVVTFTEAATAELKDRIRNRLKEARKYCITGDTQDPFLDNLINQQENREYALSLLTNAIRSFDQAAIFTIHGFCFRMLYEYAFESGSMFDTELMTDQEEFKQEILDDFWRHYLYKEFPLFINFILGKNISPSTIVSFNVSVFAHKGLKILPRIEKPDTLKIQENFKQAFSKVASSWPSYKNEIETILLQEIGLNRNTYRKSSIPALIKKMDDCAKSSGQDPFLFIGFEKFTKSSILKATKKKHDPVSHHFFGLCEDLKQIQDELLDLFEQSLIALKIELIAFLQTQLVKRKKDKNIRSFDDLLLNLYNAINKNDGQPLLNTLRNTYQAALIDEFQDTDPIQYAIFNKIFEDKNSILFLIGDPKQAIYGFRGADIFTYMGASKKAEKQYTLSENWRSDASLINAINTIFNNVKTPFVFDDIGFNPVTPAPKKESDPLIIDGKAVSPFNIWYIDAENKKGISKTIAREKITLAVTAEISHLLHLSNTNRATLGKKRIKEGDIAVLVRRNSEAEIMQNALFNLNIKSVVHSSGNIFDSFEAFEMERVLRGIISPNSESALKSALTTQMIGFTGNTIFHVMQDESEYEEIRARFRTYNQMWCTQGFIRMFNYFMKKENILGRLMGFQDGERRSTNIRHLAEILHETNIREHPGLEELIAWLSRQRDPSRPRLEEHQLRLESDENAVKLVTVHKSKGLEYPIVFCPFMWDGSKIKNKDSFFSFHDQKDSMRLTLDFGSDDMEENKLQAEKEILAENARLLYVALTRAKNCCYMVFGHINEAETSAPAYLFHTSKENNDKDSLSFAANVSKNGDGTQILPELEKMSHQADGNIIISPLPAKKGEVYSPSAISPQTLDCLKFTGDIENNWQFSSFTSLIHNFSHDTESVDSDLVILPNNDVIGLEKSSVNDQEKNIFLFPRGATTGNCLHDIFEHLDYTENTPSHRQHLVTEKLMDYGFESQWQETILWLIKNVLKSPMNSDNTTFSLSDIGIKDRINELEFYFPLTTITPDKLKQVLQKYEGTGFSAAFIKRVGQLNFGSIKGFLKGFIDLVFTYKGRFFLLDWKSNYLGNRYEDYTPKALSFVMEKELYILQYLIYTVALNQYLKTRMPSYDYETSFGGIYYIFLRGINPDKATGCGIYRDVPDRGLIEELSEALVSAQ